MKHLLLISLILLYSCHSTTSKKGQEYETDGIPQQEELCPDSISETEPISLGKKQEKSPQAISLILQPVPRDIPTGEAINPDSLSMQTEYDYYPLATTEVKVIITNHSHFEYDCGESYSLAYYNSKQKSWETLPTNPIINSILWIFPSDYPTHEQTIKLYTSEVPNRAGKYRIYKSFNDDTKVAYAEFELVDEAGAKRLRKQMDAARHNKNIISSQNLYASYMRGDSIFVDLINNSIHFQKLFRKEILNYSAISYGAVRTSFPLYTKSICRHTANKHENREAYLPDWYRKCKCDTDQQELEPAKLILWRILFRST